MADTEAEAAAGRGAEAGESSGRPVGAEAPYRAEVVRGDGQWHLTVSGLDDHPDRGEVDALVVTVPQDGAGEALPAKDLDRMLHKCGFARDADWTGHDDRWTAPCRQSTTWAAPPAPPTTP
ncbi:hypothetical protein [Streptomyces sp. NBC_01190]|uniref:hypothetical protein n=1 Tax=Streptomyces sp. NBC_01190 TaxID=2903767 RepID=UPI003867F56F|nr:hypothetical protein OG519_15475 [Streptomyces sp. NBC_01190]